MRIIALSGSLREGSYNTALARALAELAPAGCRIEVATPEGIPLYDGDLEARDGVPPAAARLKERLAVADGLVLVTPEYNQGVPGTLKNTLDWMSRPPSDIERVFAGKPVAICGATPGGGGTRTAQYAWLPTLRALRTRVYAEAALLVPHAQACFDNHGRLVDEDVRGRARSLLEGFCAFIGGR